jgi:hypothetical protein
MNKSSMMDEKSLKVVIDDTDKAELIREILAMGGKEFQSLK